MTAVAAIAQSSVCVNVRIQINQQLTLERQGFQAEMILNNPGITDLKDLSITVNFTDANGVPVMATSDPNNTTAKFFIQLTSSATLPDSVPAGTIGDFKWTIVPVISAGGSNPTGTLYFVGATVNYSLNGNATTINVSPASIQVLPMPQLTLDYFLPSEVYGDDPLTPQIEPSIPFSMGVRVKNTGFGTANQLQIESSQPQIVDNRQGLAVNFSLLGSEVNGQSVSPTLLANFGNINPASSGVARWLMTASLYGRFTNFTAVFTHSDSLGGALTSLITSVQTHQLVHDVLVDLPGRDNIRDFLAIDPDAMRVYESENNDSTVTDLSKRASVSGSGNIRTVSVLPATGFSYVQLSDPFGGLKIITAVTRADGKSINLNNAWLSSTYLPNTFQWNYFLNIFDTNNTGGFAYNVSFGKGVNHAPILTQPPTLFAHAGNPLSFLVRATDVDDDPLTLTASSLPAGATFVDSHLGVGTFSWTPDTGQTGSFSVPFTVSDGSLTDQKAATIVVTAGSLLSAWKDHYFPGITDQAIIGNMADPDHDGVPNILEYALGMDPTVSDLAGLPVEGTTVSNGQTFLTLTYVGRTGDPALSFSVTGLSDLQTNATWQALTNSMPADQSDVPTGFQRTIMLDSVPIDGTAPHHFLRLEVTTTETE